MGMPEYADFLDLAERYDEVRLDTTMAFTDFTERFAPFPEEEQRRLADLGDRILLGTDFPNIPYPYVHQLHALERLGLGDDWLRAVCHENAAALAVARRDRTPDSGSGTVLRPAFLREFTGSGKASQRGSTGCSA